MMGPQAGFSDARHGREVVQTPAC